MDPTTEKIKKLLRLGKSCNPHEAELALKRAFELAEKNHIDLASLDVEDDLKRIALQAHRVGCRISYLRKQALGICNAYFNVTPVISRPDIAFIGTQSDIEIAIHVFEFLSRSCSRDLMAASKHFPRRRFSRNRMVNFVNGFFYGVANNLSDASREMLSANEQYAIVLQSDKKRRAAWIAENMRTETCRLLPAARRNVDALMLGHSYGDKVQINSPLPRGSAPLALSGGVK